jgi:hypothetical protein
MSHKHAKDKLASALDGREVQVVINRRLTDSVADVIPLLTRQHHDMFDAAAPHLRCNLLKEAAAAIEDTETMDAVLSLGFLTPETISGFVDNLPTYDECLSKLSELLIAVRVGLEDVPEAAVLSCVRNLHKVVEGLEGLRIRVGASNQGITG